MTASRQYGLVTTVQLRQAGVSKRQTAALVAAGALLPVRRGVYRVAGTTPTWMGAVLGAVLAAGDGTLATSETAGSLWQLRHVDRPAAIDLVSARRLRMTGVEWHAAPPGIADIGTRYRRIPVTTVEATIALLAPGFDRSPLGELVDDALRRKILRLERLRQIAAALDGPGRRNLSALSAVLADRPRHYRAGDSDWEQSRDALWERLGLPTAERQYPVTVASGRRYTLDRALPDLRVGIEWDGYQFHAGRSAFDRDRRRTAELQAAGWTVLQFTSNATASFIDRVVRETIESQRGALSPAGPSASAARPP